jgi:O-antigen/teichoic acid export membrane protein
VEALQEQENIAKEIQTAIRHSAVYGLGNVLAKILGFLMLPIYTHYLSPGDYGILEILDLSMSLFGMFLNMGLTAAVLRGYAGAKSKQEKQNTMSTAFMFVTATGLLVFCIGVALVRPASALLFGPSVPATYLLVSFSAFVLGFIVTLPRTYLRALDASGAFVIVDTASLVLLLVLNVILIVVFRIGLLGILLSSLLVASLQVVLLSAWMLRKVGIAFRAPLLRQMLAFGAPLMFSNLAVFTLNFSDRFFLQHLRSLEVVGVYAIGYKFGYMLNYLLVQPFFVMWQSRMFVIHTHSDHPKIFGQFFMLYSLLLVYAGLALSLLSPEIVHVMVGSQFAASQEVIPIVSLAYILYGIGYYTQVGMFVMDKTNLIGMIGIGAAILNLALNYFLILHYGMLGAAWATLLSFLAMAVGSYWMSNRVYPLPLRVGRVATAIMFGVGCYVFSQWCSPRSFAMALLIKALLLASFPIFLWKARLLSQAEIGTLLTTRDSVLAVASRWLGLASRKAASV